eukprot:15191-Heterococcus_DN1.PRE.3
MLCTPIYGVCACVRSACEILQGAQGCRHEGYQRCEACGGPMKGGGYKLDGDKRVRWCVQCKPANAIPGRVSTRKKKASTDIAAATGAATAKLHAISDTSAVTTTEGTNTATVDAHQQETICFKSSDTAG